MACRIFTFLFLFCGFSSFSQENPELENAIKKYAEYFSLNRESVHLHLNKTTFAPTEDLWFSAYAYNTRFQIPNPSTTNLNVNIYNGEGKLMDVKTIFVGNGKGSGFLKLDTAKYAPGNYLIKASTKYMENFREELSFSQKFKILGETDSTSIPIKYDLQFLPEGGHLVEGVNNSVGVKLIDNSGKGVFFTEAKVMDSKGNVTTTFKSNQFGISKFNLEPKPNESYTVHLIPENHSETHQKIEAAEPTGIVMTANTSLPKTVVFSIKTNQATYPSLEGKTFYLGIAQKGSMKALGFVIPESLEAIVKIPKTELFPGTNRITLFNENIKPIAERLIFNRKGIKRKQINAEYKKRFMDSLVIGLNTPDSLGLHSLSVSVLPGKTKSYNPRNNILSSFYIEPYINGKLEKGSYYFSRETNLRRRDYDLDLLLLTQGWSKYSWKNIFNHTPVEYYKNEQGFSLDGTVNGRNEKKENQLFVKSPESGFFTIVELDNKGAFELENLFLQENDTISFGLIHDRKGKVSKPGVYFRLLPQKNTKDISGLKNLNQKIDVPPSGSTENQSPLPETFLKGKVELSEIILQAELQEKEEDHVRHSSNFFRTTIIDETLASSFTYITDYIRSQGFMVNRGFKGVTILSQRALTLRGLEPPRIYLDGILLQDNQELMFLHTKDVKSVSINKTGAGYGLNGFGGVIEIKTKTSFTSGKRAETASTSILENGFSPNKEFYAPKYAAYDNSFFQEYGAIGWFSDVILDKNGRTEIKVWETLQAELKLFIEGITTDGNLISEEIKLKVE